MKRLVACLVSVACLTVTPWLTVVRAAAGVVRSASGFGNDATVTFAAAPSASNVVVVLSLMNSETNTIDLTGTPTAEVVLFGPTDSTADVHRAYGWCFVNDGADTNFVVTTTGAGSAVTVALELSGMLTCAGSAILDGFAAQDVSDLAGPPYDYTLPSAFTTTQDGDLIVGLIRPHSGAADFTATGDDASIDAGDAEISTSSALGQYKVVGAAGSYNLTYTSLAGESTYLAAMALKASTSSGCRRALLGVGC